MIRDGERKLAYIAEIAEILPIPNADRIEVVRVGGWQVVVSKEDHYKVGDKVVYIEIDSKVPSDRECFAFLQDKKYKVKSIKLRGQVSQGLVMPLSILPDGEYNVGDDVTEILGIEKIENDFKQPLESNEMRLRGAHPKLYRKKWFKKFMKYSWFRKFALKFLIPKKKKSGWPAWIVKSDSERIQNMIWVLNDKSKFYVSEKIDGTSTSFSLYKDKGRLKFMVCSRNVVQTTPDKQNYYSDFGLDNVYWEMALKYDIEKKMRQMFKEVGAQHHITIQGETYGEGIQKNKYNLKGRDLAIFNFYVDGKYMNPRDMRALMAKYELPLVPLVSYDYVLPDTFEELMEFSTGKSQLYDTLREGYVFKSYDGQINFKCVSNDFLLKWKE